MDDEETTAIAIPPRATKPRRSLFTGLVIAALLLAGFCFVAAPWEAFRALRSAALAGDVQGMTGLMDVDAVRASLRAQLPGANPVPAPNPLDDPAGALRNALGGRLPGEDADVEGFLTPDALVHFTHAHSRQPNTPFRIGDLLSGLHDSEIRFWGPNRARIAALAPGSGDQESIFTFERRGLFKWRLTQIRLPAPVERD